MGEPYRYQSGWKTEDLFSDYYTKSQIVTLISSAYGLLAITGSSLTTEGRLYIKNDKIYVYYNGIETELHTLTTSAPVTIEDGVPMGLLIALTYQT